MQAELYRLAFSGGPSDGVVMTTTNFPYQDARAPSTVFAGGSDDVRPSEGKQRWEYRLIVKRHLVEDGHPIVQCEYEFVRFKLDGPLPEKKTITPWFKTLARTLLTARHAIPVLRGHNDDLIQPKASTWVGQ